ncbi:MAG TPA: hypothetical protein VKY40_00240 [Halanaerobiales bacterium]|nr:hypothetical protein [Halanaerobiales bacterium]
MKENKKIIKLSEFKIEEIEDFDTYVEADSKLYYSQDWEELVNLST